MVTHPIQEEARFERGLSDTTPRVLSDVLLWLSEKGKDRTGHRCREPALFTALSPALPGLHICG